MKHKVTLRPACDADRGFILNSWVRSYAKRAVAGIPQSRIGPPRTDPDVYMDGQNRVSEVILGRSTATVACSCDDDDQIFGYIVYELPDTLHYIYVKVPFRRLGIGRLLVSSSGLGESKRVYSTHWGPSIPKIFDGIEISYNPYRWLE